jgi:hypothetical protein
MKILVLSNITKPNNSNPFTANLIKSLAAQPEVSTVEHGTLWIDFIDDRWDVVIIQWPHELLSPLEQVNFKKLSSWLHRVALKAVIVSIVHNLSVHYRKDILSMKLYDLINEISSGFIHLGQTSVESYSKQYPVTKDKPYVVVPHGNYECFGEPVTANEARSKLKIPQERPVALILGAIRAKEEFDLSMTCLKVCRELGGYLLFVGQLQFIDHIVKGSQIIKKMIRLYYRFRMFITGGLFSNINKVPNSLMHLYVSASDVVVIPRKVILNSGNVALGFTYGRIVVGPDVGNVGNILRNHNNPVFNPCDEDSLHNAVRQGFMMAAQGEGENNRIIALNEWAWPGIGEKIVKFAVSLIR